MLLLEVVLLIVEVSLSLHHVRIRGVSVSHLLVLHLILELWLSSRVGVLARGNWLSHHHLLSGGVLDKARLGKARVLRISGLLGIGSVHGIAGVVMGEVRVVLASMREVRVHMRELCGVEMNCLLSHVRHDLRVPSLNHLLNDDIFLCLQVLLVVAAPKGAKAKAESACDKEVNDPEIDEVCR